MLAKLKFLPALSLVFLTLWFRFINLGYSDFSGNSGDEINALYLPAQGERLVDFLLRQRKGPTEFLVTALVRFFTPDYTNKFLTRLPFALAGTLAVFFFYKLMALHFGKKVAFYATLFMATNGIFIGLTRFIQYQSFVILFSVLALYFFSLALYEEKWRLWGIYTGMLFWVAALLTHYDGVFIAPFAIYLFYRWYTENAALPASTRIRQFAAPAVVSALVLFAFYIPFFASVDQTTVDYWASRITETAEALKPSSSIYTFKLYNPLLALPFYCLAGLLSLVKIKSAWPVWLWFLFPWTVLEVVLREPGTHIYAYLLPACALAGFGLVAFEEQAVKRLGGRWGWALVGGVIVASFAFMAALDHFMFIDHTPEYPWMQRRFLFWKLGGLSNPEYQTWTYGFPYNRHWQEVQEYILSHEPNGYYATNEEKGIADYYIPLQHDIEKAGYYIDVYTPLDLRQFLAKEKIRYWIKNYPPVKEFKNGDLVVTKIYLMPEGDLTTIRNQGY